MDLVVGHGLYLISRGIIPEVQYPDQEEIKFQSKGILCHKKIY